MKPSKRQKVESGEEGGVGGVLREMLENNDDHEHWAYVSSVACQFRTKQQHRGGDLCLASYASSLSLS